MDSRKNYHTSADEDEDIYVNTQDCYPESKKCADIPEHTELKDNKKTGKIIISALGVLLILGALSTLCVIGILYHNEVVSYEILSLKYTNITATLMEHKSLTTERDRQSEELKVKYQQVQGNLSACNNKTKRQFEELKVQTLTACNANKNSGRCGNGWKPFGMKCYYFSNSKLNWALSRDDCVGKGGHLVVISSKAEQIFLSSQIRESHWIGLNDLDTEGEWMWVNKQPLKDTCLKFWFTGPLGPYEPDNWKTEDPSGENCGVLDYESDHTKSWFDASCSKLKQFICEKENAACASLA